MSRGKVVLDTKSKTIKKNTKKSVKAKSIRKVKADKTKEKKQRRSNKAVRNRKGEGKSQRARRSKDTSTKNNNDSGVTPTMNNNHSSDKKSPSKTSDIHQREHHVETIQINDKNIPARLYQINEDNIFEAMIFPMTSKDFYERIFAQKALVIKGTSSKRFQTIVETQMFNLDVKKMCKNTASEKIHMWFPNRQAIQGKQTTKIDTQGKHQHVKEKEIKSYDTEDYHLAVTSYERGGASLYFGSSLEFRNSYCKALTYRMGMNFGAYFNDYNTMGEIETFCSRKGNLTDWHTDFQENFTLQIRGSKKWVFKRSGLQYPCLGYTPHFAQSGNLEEQNKVHLAYNRIDMNKEYQDINKDTFEVILEEGDILYHPAGIWHQVECLTDDSISINFSIRQVRVADLITNAQKMILLQMDQGRQGIRTQISNQIPLIGANEQHLLSLAFDLKYVKPPCIYIPRVMHYDMDKDPQGNGKLDYQECFIDEKVKLNPFFVLNKLSEFPQIPEDAEGFQYIVNGLFGNEDYSSMVRVLLQTKSSIAELICDQVIQWRTDKSPDLYQQSRSVEDFLKNSGLKKDPAVLKVFKNLIFNGVLVKSE